MLTFSAGLAAALGAVASQTEWITTLINTLGSSRTITCKRADTNSDVWADGTTFLQAAMIGPMTGSGAEVTGFGTVGAAVTQTAADLATGFAVLRIAGGGEWIQGTLGLNGSGADFTLRASPAANTGFAFKVGTTISAPANLPLTPPGSLVATLTLLNNSSTPNATSPATLGHSFAPGDWLPGGYDLKARTTAGNPIPIQADAISTHPDGSVRYAVLSVDPGALAAGQSRVVELVTSVKQTPASITLSVPAWQLSVDATIYGVQQTQINCGQPGGAKFTQGQTFTLRLTLGGLNYDYSVTITPQMAADADDGGSFYLVAEAMAAQVEAGGVFRGLRIGSGGGFRSFWVEPAATNAGSFTVSVVNAAGASVTYSNLSEYAAPVVWTATSKPQLEAQIAASNSGSISNLVRRLHGPVVSELRQVVKFKNPSNVEHPFLTAFFDTRLYADGRAWTDVIFENTGFTTPSPKAINYKAEIKVDGAIVHTQSRFWHFARTRWHAQVWIGGDPKVVTARDREYLFGSKAVPNYPLTYAPTGPQLDAVASIVTSQRAAGAYLGPMAPVRLSLYMPTTGGRIEIGPLHEDAVSWLLSQDVRALSSVRAMADSSAGPSIHYRDEATGQPVSVADHPSLCVSSEPFGTVSRDPHRNYWTPDTSHQGSFSYVPYLATGDSFYMEEVLFWASWNLAVGNPSYRFASGVGNLLDNEIRGTAWTTRALAEASWVLPDDHPMKSYYTGQLNQNIAYIANQLGTGRFASPLGAFMRPEGDCPPWQNDYFMCVMALLVENNVPRAVEIFNHVAEFTVGRVLADDEGFCAALAPGYYTYLRDGGMTGNYLATWSEYSSYNYPAEFGQACNTLAIAGYPSSAEDYAANLRAMLGACVNAGFPDASAAYTKWAAMTTAMVPAFQSVRRWAISPR